jgi:hypothetical protein
MPRLHPILILLILTSVLSLSPGPRLIPDDSVAGDLRSLAQETWDRFLAVFKLRRDCFGDVHLHAAGDLKSRAVYDPATATVTVRVPATIAMLQGALIHEWAHHVEYQCQAQQQLRPGFLAAQKLAPDTPWQTGYRPAEIPESEWARIPSEQYAEAAIELVLGERQIPTTVRVQEEAVAVLASWASGR